MNARVGSASRLRASGRLRLDPRLAGRVYSSSARLLESGCSTSEGKCGEPGRTVGQKCLNISIPACRYARQDVGKFVPVAHGCHP